VTWMRSPMLSQRVSPFGCIPRCFIEGLAGWKNMTSVLLPLTVSPSWCSPCRTSFIPRAKWAAAELKVGPEAKTAPSSTYREKSAWLHSCVMKRSGAVNRAEMMGEAGDPCGVPHSGQKVSEVYPLMCKVTSQSPIRLLVQATVKASTPRCSKMRSIKDR
jgi:hypothetical protein